MIDVLNLDGKWIIVQFVGHALGDEDDNLMLFDTPEEAQAHAEGLTYEDEEDSVPLVAPETYGGYL